MHSTAVIIGVDPKTMGSRISGLCRDMFMQKRTLKQAPCFTAEAVLALEEFALNCKEMSDSVFTNFILFCIYASCRIGDASKIRDVEFTRHHDVFPGRSSDLRRKEYQHNGTETDAPPFFSNWVGPPPKSLVHQVADAAE